ncbi:MAG: transglycosylase domain-containing protein [Pseudomonadota bacterium]
MSLLKNNKVAVWYKAALFIVFSLVLCAYAAIVVCRSVLPIPASLSGFSKAPVQAYVLDRYGKTISSTRQNEFNHTPLPLWKIPETLQKAFIIAEDKRFYSHKGVDWTARGKAVLDNLIARRIVRGASTIPEQTVRLIHPRTRTLLSRLIETIEAYQLSGKFSKNEILEFYLNQVPFSHQCRGIAEAADFYFGRTVDTLSTQEMLALAVIVRAPSTLNPFACNYKPNPELNKRICRLSKKMENAGLEGCKQVNYNEPIGIRESPINIKAPHFVQYIKKAFPEYLTARPRVVTTIDGAIQNKCDTLLKAALKDLGSRGVHHGAILVLNHRTDEILAWVNGTDFFSPISGSQIDAVITPRQAGSTLKPFLYAMALENGYTAATVIPDIPFSQPVGCGLHSYKNYSSTCYGPVRLRCALGNSLNIPAIRTVMDIGVGRFLAMLHSLGFESLKKDEAYYGEGLALGNGEITLHDLVAAYAVIARNGVYHEPNVFLFDHEPHEKKRIFSPEVSSLIGDILSDPSARVLEFGDSGLLDFPVQTAIKTGTSSDYRDSWAVGFNDTYTVGIWMGNLDYTRTKEVTGSLGPALCLRGVFSELNKNRETQPLKFSRNLYPKEICALSGKLPNASCPHVVTEWFRLKSIPTQRCDWHEKKEATIVTRLPALYANWANDTHNKYADTLDIYRAMPTTNQPVSMVQPTQGLHLALDPRIPDNLERFPFIIETKYPVKETCWFLNDKLVAVTGRGENQYLWRPTRGKWTAYACLTSYPDNQVRQTPMIAFYVR